MRIKTDYMRVKAIRKLVRDLDECREILKKEASDGSLNSKIQAETLSVAIDPLKKILGDH